MSEDADAHQVFTDMFSISTYPITNEQYLAFCTATQHTTPNHLHSELHPSLLLHPVVNVTWHDANAFCAWLEKKNGAPFRLPTEAEWEKAARGFDARVYAWGNVFYKTKCNCAEAANGFTTPVTNFPEGASPFGVMDLCGNVWEWCHSIFAAYPYRVDDGREDISSEEWRVLRGGSWLDYEWGVRAARRLSGAPNVATSNAGFRVITLQTKKYYFTI